jgi:hypothetical protein
MNILQYIQTNMCRTSTIFRTIVHYIQNNADCSPILRSTWISTFTYILNSFIHIAIISIILTYSPKLIWKKFDPYTYTVLWTILAYEFTHIQYGCFPIYSNQYTDLPVFRTILIPKKYFEQYRVIFRYSDHHLSSGQHPESVLTQGMPPPACRFNAVQLLSSARLLLDTMQMRLATRVFTKLQVFIAKLHDTVLIIRCFSVHKPTYMFDKITENRNIILYNYGKRGNKPYQY